ncbi:hypothetical protein [Klebsiella grimontii]|uniref:hypothetical protein n=1 Tax=Klebsiella grimontii TaxID=2058152 RepID=UPI002245FB11|nr:hypothetical protein [Klebsiella grimontii]MCW9529216.1 hypothetical protein [Klebsiella grimontii]
MWISKFTGVLMLKISDVEPLTSLEGLFTNGKVASGIPPTRLVAEWFNAVQTELVNIVENSDIELDPQDSTQVLKALNKLFLARLNPFADIASDGEEALSTARDNLGLGNSATLPVGTGPDSVAAGNDSRITGAVQKLQNLADLPDKAVARSSLELGNSATRSVGTSSGTVAAGDDSRITGAMQKSQNLADLPNKATSRSNLGLGAMATKDNPPFINEVGAYTLAWYDGSVEYNSTVNGSALYPATADGNHSSSALNGTWRCMGRTETINDQHRVTLWQKIS